MSVSKLIQVIGQIQILEVIGLWFSFPYWLSLFSEAAHILSYTFCVPPLKPHQQVKSVSCLTYLQLCSCSISLTASSAFLYGHITSDSAQRNFFACKASCDKASWTHQSDPG